ncbi:conserved hypothetical protein [Prochlorococcus marinus str. MIT 9303]|uniref:DUF4013 domain-containing protein n=1 Tax=Prochlorococcus marinus (strain MIT 9303) TaxID=59922 RepID=A2CD91_PROM3|nr:conserved hypothetical protein [Prochlorococcus marinus str. MIT 9303]
MLFQILVGVVTLPFIGIAVLGGARIAAVKEVAGLNTGGLHPVLGYLLLVVGLIGYIIVVLWGIVGLIRGAWTALDGQKPDFAVFTRWDQTSSWRLLGSLILYIVVVAAASVIAYLIGLGLGQINQALIVIPSIALAIFAIWFLVTQQFLVQNSLLGSKNSANALSSGIDVINPSWWIVLWLLIVEAVIHAIAATFHYGGLFVMVPAMVCISTAAYRQLFGSTDNTGLLKPN